MSSKNQGASGVMSYTFKVAPLCDRQKRDINERNILDNGLYRKCNVYKGGGGYDRFPAICKKRLGYAYQDQFVVQLYGCPLRCPYCYVTPEGVFGNYVEVSDADLAEAFIESRQDIFHLMGGAPALYIEGWGSVIEGLSPEKIFHSDLLLVEKEYSDDVLRAIKRENTLYAVSIKGLGDEFKANTGVPLNAALFWRNLSRVVESGINFYLTFTGLSPRSVQVFRDECERRGYPERIFADSFSIEIVQYKALIS